MNVTENVFFNEIKAIAESKDYRLIITQEDTSTSRGLGSHFVDYQNKEIIITIPSQEHPEAKEIFAHELLHAELFLNNYPRILRSPDVKYTQLDEVLSGAIEDCAHHYLMYPKLRDMNCMHDIENKRFAEMVVNNLSNSKGPNVVNIALDVLELDLRDSSLLKTIEKKVEGEQPHVYALYRRFKRYHSTIKSPRTMRECILNMFREIEKTVKKHGVHYEFKHHFALPHISNEYEKKQPCSTYFKVEKLPNLSHCSIVDKKSNQTVMYVSPSLQKFQIEKVLNESTVEDFFKD